MKWGACNQNKLLLVDYVAVNQMLYFAKFDLLLPFFSFYSPAPPPPYVFVGLLQDIRAQLFEGRLVQTRG